MIVAGGMTKGKKFKAVQLGGPSGGCVPPWHLSAPVDYESIIKLGAIVGSGGMIVMDEDKCMVDVARFFMEFCVDESCGKCTPCRVGTRQMLKILTRICKGKGEEGDIEKLEKWAAIIQNTALCGLGQTAPNPVLSTLRYFRDEYEAHIRDKRCPAVVCAAHVQARPCQHACPAGMDVPSYVALVRDEPFGGRLQGAGQDQPLPQRLRPGLRSHVCESQVPTAPPWTQAVAYKISQAFHHRQRPKRPIIKLSGQSPVWISVAVVGGGPSGLSAARDLALRGYPVTVYRGSLPEAGGMLRYGIPAYRLPRDVLADGDSRP